MGFLTTTHISSIQIISWAEPISQVQCALLLSAPLLSEKMLHIFMCFSMKIKKWFNFVYHVSLNEKQQLTYDGYAMNICYLND